MVLLRQAATDQPKLIGESAGFEQWFELFAKVHVRAGHAGQGDHIHVLFQGYARHGLGCLAQTGIDHFEACVHQGARHDLGALVVPVQARLGQ